ncbi:hypothetical protein BAUCODRAFT_144876 [Baudoinia panamericana UAMH 10762]|uniref:Uncharacterized protein n=1 Tax=Baudoinia panamericana (strain UAMH 10762) TaxID=717646 RepID=M2NJ83_BAUPA|nr:uncharacterized protein BAUCODRAFT_144876 [Baudoinia panamericana UAMH 10762]EMC99454.1 hypothetical protein BAUCODRAFT_144876 [Baudoinia panamericana UAMH 10762]
MGICASCLGLNRRSSHEVDESDPLLDHAQQNQYGGVGGEEFAEPDEEELRRQREAFDRITAEAASNMIDISQADAADLRRQLAATTHGRRHSAKHEDNSPTEADQDGAAVGEEDEETAWLQSVQSANLASEEDVKRLQSGPRVVDMSQLRTALR